MKRVINSGTSTPKLGTMSYRTTIDGTSMAFVVNWSIRTDDLGREYKKYNMIPIQLNGTAGNVFALSYRDENGSTVGEIQDAKTGELFEIIQLTGSNDDAIIETLAENLYDYTYGSKKRNQLL